MRKLNKKGFTLVEIVIVIVIIAILAAMLVPALTQWINKSKMKTFTSACGTIKTAVWAQIAENYAVNSDTTYVNWDVVTKDVGKPVAASGATYNVTSFNWSADKIVIEDAAFTGNWTGNTWDVKAK